MLPVKKPEKPKFDVFEPTERRSETEISYPGARNQRLLKHYYGNYGQDIPSLCRLI